MTAAQRVPAAASIIVLALLAAAPWGLPSEDRFFLPLLPVVAIHYWALRNHALVPEWAVFAAGLALDILTYGPLGYWSLIYLTAYAFAVQSAPYGASGPAARLGLLAAAIIGVATIAWLVASLYYFEAADWRPYALGAAFAAICSVPLLALLRAIDVARRAPNAVRLERGG